MKNKKLILIAVALIACVAVMLGIFVVTRPETVSGAKTITVTVVHKDGSEKVFTCATDEEYLGKVLVNENIVVGNYGEFGLYFDTADGEKGSPAYIAGVITVEEFADYIIEPERQ